MEHLLQGGCCPSLADNEPPLPSSIAGLLEKMVAQVWRDKGVTELNLPIVKAYAHNLWQGVTNGYGASSPDFDTPDFNMLASLEKNTWQFSAAKNYTQLRELGAALLDENGKLRTFEQFKAAALTINDKYILRYARAEYELAVAGAQMASKWVDIEKNANTLPLLQFDAVLDAQTTSLCRGLHGTILPFDHVFWDINYPPNHFRCRSTVRQLRSGALTPADKIPSADIPPMFRTNLAKRGLIFPKDHPYFVDIPTEVLNQALRLMPYESQFTTIFSEGGIVRQHFLVDETASDYKTVLTIAREKAASGKVVDIMPTLEMDDFARPIIFPDAKNARNADLRINGTLTEVEEVKKMPRLNTLKHSIAEASHQADYVIIKLPEKVDYELLKRVANGRFIDHKSLLVIEFRQPNGTYEVFERPKATL